MDVASVATMTKWSVCARFSASPQPKKRHRWPKQIYSVECSRGQIEGNESSMRLIRQVADLCVHCYQCRDECPASVDIPKMSVECKAQNVAANGIPISDWLFIRLDMVSGWGSRFRSIANPMLHTPWTRWFARKTYWFGPRQKTAPIGKSPFFASCVTKKADANNAR